MTASATAPARIDLRRLRPAPAGLLPSTSPGQVDRLRMAPVVTTLQLLLRPYYVTIRADGSYGPQTRAGVLAFQARVGRERTGRLVPADWAALLARSEVTLGSRGNVVRALQLLLNHRLPHGAQIIEDGILGTGTLMQVQGVQRAAGLRVTRTVDTATFGALLPR